jgi:hypothetical protein
MGEIELPCISGTVPAIIEYPATAPLKITRQKYSPLRLPSKSPFTTVGWRRGSETAAVVDSFKLIDRWQSPVRVSS